MGSSLLLVNLVMDEIANRSKGFAFLSYTTEDESKFIEGIHGKVAYIYRAVVRLKVIFDQIAVSWRRFSGVCHCYRHGKKEAN